MGKKNSLVSIQYFFPLRFSYTISSNHIHIMMESLLKKAIFMTHKLNSNSLVYVLYRLTCYIKKNYFYLFGYARS